MEFLAYISCESLSLIKLSVVIDSCTSSTQEAEARRSPDLSGPCSKTVGGTGLEKGWDSVDTMLAQYA